MGRSIQPKMRYWRLSRVLAEETAKDAILLVDKAYIRCVGTENGAKLAASRARAFRKPVGSLIPANGTPLRH